MDSRIDKNRHILNAFDVRKAPVRLGSFRFQGCPVPCIPVRPVRSVQSVRCGSVLAVPSVPVSAVPVRFAAILKVVPRHKN